MFSVPSKVPVLRPYQIDLVDDITTEAAQGHRRILLQSFMGSGKTVIAAEIIRHAESNGQHCLFLAPRREIVSQTLEKLEAFGVEAAIMQHGEPYDYSQKFIVASIQTFYSWIIRRKNTQKPKADIVIIDEAHGLQGSKSWQKIVDAYPNAFILGMTATPVSKSGKGLAAHFDTMVCGPSVKELTDQKYLVPVKYFCPSIPDLKKVRVFAGDYSEKDLSEAVDTKKLVGDIIENWLKICPKKQTLVFACGIKHSVHIVSEFNAIGIKAAHVDGDTPASERDEIIRKFRSKEIQVLSNCAVYCEGTDIPEIECLVFARPTKSLVLFLQISGRALRPSPGKETAIFLDHAGVIYQHGMIDQNWDWKLEYLEGNIGTAMKKKKKEPKPITCEQCKLIYTGKLTCPNCGNTPKVFGKAVPTYEAYLQEIDAIENPKKKLPLTTENKQFYQELLGYCFKKGYSKGFAYHKFIEKFGEKPQWNWQYLRGEEPGPEVLSWIRHLQIRYAKRRQDAPPPAQNLPVDKEKYVVLQ